MLKLLKYYPTNWIDGLKLNKDHFIQNEFAFHDEVRDSLNIRINSWNFGLLAGLESTDGGLIYQIDLDRSGLLRVRLDSCRAITPAGGRLEIVNIPGQKIHANIGVLNTEFNFQSHNGKILYVVVSVNPFERAAFGDVDPMEHPPKFPNTKPHYSVDVIPEEQFVEAGPFHLPIAKIQVQAGAARIMDEYVPPSTSMLVHPVLKALFDDVDVFLTQMELNCSLIQRKIYEKSHKKELAEMALYICERMVMYLNNCIHSFRWTYADLPPIHTFSVMAGLARTIKNSLEIRSGSGREEFINYLTDWDEFNLQQGEFEALLNDLVLMEYDHLNIDACVKVTKNFSTKMNQVFAKLAKLDYIGKKEDPGIIVAQRSAQEASKKASSKGSGIWLD